MANLTGSYDADDKPAELVGYNMKAATLIYKGALVAVDDASGFLVKAGDLAAVTFAGVAFEGGDNRTGADGGLGLRVTKVGSMIYGLSGVAASQAVIGKKAYAFDDNTVCLFAASTNKVYVGDIVALVVGGQVRVRINRAGG